MKRLRIFLAVVMACTSLVAQAADTKDDTVIISEATVALEKDPKNLEARGQRGDAYDRQREFTAAIADYDFLIAKDPLPHNYFRRANSYMHRGDAEASIRDYDAAILDFDETIKRDDGSVYSYYFRGVLYGKKGMHDKAIVDIGEAIKRNPGNIWFFFSRGKQKYDASDYSGAIADWEKAGELGFDKQSVQEHVKDARSKMK